MKDRWSRKTAWLCGVLAAAFSSSLATPSRAQTRGPHEPVHELDLGEGTQALYLQIAFASRTDVSLEAAQLMSGNAPGRIGNPPLLRFRLEDASGASIEEFNAWHPLWEFVWDGESESRRILSEAMGNFVVPFTPELARIELTDVPLNQQLLAIRVADFEVLEVAVIDPPSQLVVGEPVEITLETVVTNNGPSTPLDALVTLEATAPSGTGVDPESSESFVPALATGEQRVVTHTVSIRCDLPGFHDFSFTGEIEPGNSNDADLDPSNDAMSAELSVDCLVPVAVNNKPGSNPNWVNLRGITPVAVLTTEAGEYGLPLAFDATQIAPLSVRFGPREPVFEGTGGVAEVHGTGHLEDSRERIDSEKIQDGDVDMAFHFENGESGLTPADVEACVKGEATDPGSGGSFRFFGCDAISIR